ncbi:unnamed protein product [Prorocentrum cordatum]|uniref:RNA-directed RNA polymerase n=1 Tax=Prorocentrum cordatum TaxID=2364126 RepID=A0ABN9SIS7_9DINO|nr:unnamed protein product [Polarella glacialis]
MPMAAGSFYLVRFNVPGREIWHERLVIQGALIKTPDGDVCHDFHVLSRDARGIKPLSGQGAAVDGIEAASAYRFKRPPAAVQVWGALREAAAGGAAALPHEDFALELGEGNVIGMAPGPLFLRDPLAAPVPAAAGPLVAAAPPALGAASAPLAPPDPLGDALAAALRPGAPPGAHAGGTAAPPAGEHPSNDFRVLAAARGSRGRRDRSFGDALKEQTECEREDWPALGPRTLLWVLQFMLRMAGGAVAWHTRWHAVMGLAEGDEAAKQHETICRILETSMVHDQLVITELASFEYLARQLQLIEERVYDEKTRKAAAALKGQGKKDSTPQDALSTEVGHFLGIGETKGNLCICPALMQFIAEQMRDEAAVSKERRKAREERALPPAFASGMLCRCRPSTWATVFTPLTVGALASAQLAVRLGAGGATRVSMHSTGSMIVLLRDVSRVLSTTPGYQRASRVRPYDKALAAWPALSGPPVEVSSVAQQADAVQLQGWRQGMLRSAGEVEELQVSLGAQQPYVDPLLRDPRKYAEFLNATLQRHMIEWTVASPPSSPYSVGIFFVEKNGGKLRLVLDTRVANTYFKPPPNSVLPTPSARASLESSGDFYVAQGGIQCAFYHMAVPPDRGDFLRLPTISNRFVGLKNVGSLSVGRRALLQPVVRLMPIGWNWALYFCQSALVRGMIDAGIQPNRHLADGAAPTPLASRSDLVAAGYVDNFCAVSQSAALATAKARELAQTLTSRGLPVHDFTEAQTEGVCTGIQFSGKTGMLRARPDRLARLRRATLALASRGSASRGALASIVGHATWAMIMRRECLPIFNGVYRFIQGACMKKLDPFVLSSTGRVAEKWRYRVSEAISARAHAFEGGGGDEGAQDAAVGCSLPSDVLLGEGGVGSVSDFVGVPSVLYDSEEWVIIHSSRHRRAGLNILEYEGEALCFAVRHVHSTCDISSDAWPLSVSLTTGIRAIVRWIPSGRNVADGPSRTGFFAGPWKDFEAEAGDQRSLLYPGLLQLLRGETSFLENAAVTQRAQDSYHAHAARVHRWCTWTGQSFETAARLAALLPVFFGNLCLGMFDTATGRMTMAALRHLLPHLLTGPRALPRAARALEGWGRLVPPQMRLPLPRSAMLAVVGLLIQDRRFAEAVFVRLAFDTYLMPSEAYRLVAASLVEPRAGSVDGHQHWGMIVNDATTGGPGKTGVTDESVNIDNASLWPLFQGLKRHRAPMDPPWSFAPSVIRQVFREACAGLGIWDGVSTLCALRHGGASDDLLSGRRSRKEVRGRGGWVTDASLNRYAKRSRMQQLIAAPPQCAVALGSAVGGREEELISTTTTRARSLPPLPPDLPAAKLPKRVHAPLLSRRWRFG